jgi:GNAT superfamily N-acetyltransferase
MTMNKILSLLGLPADAGAVGTSVIRGSGDGTAADTVPLRVRLPARWTTSGGDVLTLRAARASDSAGIRAFIDGLSRESRYYRFMTGARVPDAHIDAFVGSDAALVVTTQVAGEETIIASAHYVVDRVDVRREAEFAIAVDDGWQGKGIGRTLIQRMFDMARHAGLDAMRGDVLSENRRMLAVMRGFGFSVRRHPEDGLVHVVWMGLGETTSVGARSNAQ